MTLRRDWADAREKVDTEGCCRWCGQAWNLETAHIIGRSRDERARGASIARVNPDTVVPLCRSCHALYDAGGLSLLGALTPQEEAAAVLAANGLEAARRRIMGSVAWRQERAA